MRRFVTNVAKATLPFELRLVARRLDWRRRYLRGYLEPATGRKYCPIAGREFRHFARTARGGLLTPSNGAQARHRVIWLYLERETSLFEGGKSLLHVAPERCLLERFSSVPGLLYVPGDKMARGYGRQSGVRPLDLLAIDFPEETFDYVLCNHVLEHVEADAEAIRELFRVLKPGGTAVVTVPIRRGPTLEDASVTTPRDRARVFGQWDHVRHYGEDVTERFADRGFEVRLERYARRLGDEERLRCGLDDTAIIVAQKPGRAVA